MDDLASKWSGLSNVEQNEIALGAAGVRQKNIFIATMQHYSEVLTNTESATNSVGVAQAKQDIYMQSLSAHLAQLGATFEKLYTTMASSSGLKSFVDILASGINIIASFSSVVGTIPAVLTIFATVASLASLKVRTFMSDLLGITAISTFITGLKSAQQAMWLLSGTKMSLIKIGFNELTASVYVYTMSIKEAFIGQYNLGRVNNLSPLTAGFRALGAAATEAGVASKIGGLAISVGIGMATLGLSVVLALTIGKLMEFADNMMHAGEKAKEAFGTLQKSISTTSSEVAQSETLISTYEDLSSKVNKTADEKTKLAEVTEKLAGLYGQSVIGYDSEGKAIIGSADSLREYLDLKKQELELDKQKLTSDFYKNESTQMDSILDKQSKLNKLKDDLSNAEQSKTDIIQSAGTPESKVSKIAGADVDINKIKGQIAEAQTAIMSANADMSGGLKAVTQTELESLNLSSTSLDNFSKSYMGIISKISASGKAPTEVLSSLFNTFKTDANIKPIIDGWDKSLTDLQKGNIDASKAEEIHKNAVNDLTTEISRANPNMSMGFIKPFVEGLIVLNGIAPEATSKVKDVTKAMDEANTATDDYLKNGKDLASTVAKMNDGHKLTTEELYTLIKNHKELAPHMVKVNGLYTIEQQAIIDVMDANTVAYKKKMEQNNLDLESSRALLLAKLGFNKAEIESGISLAQAKKNLIDGSDSRDAGANSSQTDTNQPAIDALQQIEDQIKSNAITGQITAKDLIANDSVALEAARAKKDAAAQKAADALAKAAEKIEAVTGPFADQIRASAKANNISATLVDAVIKQESGFKNTPATATSPTGAKGLMQLMPGTAKDLGVSNVWDSAQNIAGGSKYLSEMMKKFGNSIELALSAYNWGSGNLQNSMSKHGTTTFAQEQQYMPQETKSYVSKIMSDYNSRKTNETAVNQINNSSATPEIPAYKDASDVILQEIALVSKLTSEKSALIQKDIDIAKSTRDYSSAVSKTNDLISSQTLEMTQLTEARTKINNIKDSSLASASSSYGDINRWLNQDNEMSSTYINEYNQSSAETQKNMELEFTNLQKLRKSWVENKNSIDSMTLSIENLKTTLVSTEIDQYNNTISSVDKHLAQSKATMDLYNISSKEYTQEQNNQTLSLKNKQDAIDEEIAKVKDQLTNTKLTAEATNILIDQMSKLSLDSASNKKAMADSSTSQLDNQYQIQQKQNSELETSLSLQLQIQEAVQPKNYDMINVILQSQISAQTTNLSQIQESITALTTQRDLLQQSSAEWQVINDKITSYQSTLQSAMTTLSATYKSQLDNQTNKQLHTAELSIFGGQTEDQAKQALQDKVNYQNEYISGEEKAASILRIRNQLAQDNASLNGGFLDAQKNQLTLSQQQLALLNSSADIKRSDLDLLEKQLQIQKTQAELSDSQNQKSIRVLTDKSGNGDYQWTWQADQTKTLQLQGTLYQEQQDLAKTQQDDKNKSDQDLLNQKSEYLANIKTVVTNAQNGEYADTTAFNDAMTSANTGFLTSLQDSNTATWNNISSNISSNLNTIISAYTTYVGQMSGLQSQANSLASSITNSGSSGGSSGSSYSGSNGNTNDFNITKNGSYDQATGNYTITKADGTSTTGNGTPSDYEKKFSSFGTGGETGSWGDSGKLGILHEKERVLTAEQTSSFNALIAKLPDITSILKNISIPDIMSNFRIPTIDFSNIKLPNMNNGVASDGGGITINTLNVTSNSASDLVSQLQNLVRLTK